MAGPLDAPLDGRAIAAERAELTARATLAGRPLAEQLAAQADAWFARLGRDLTRSWALVATGGYARGMLCPGSDIDVVLLHPRKAKPAEVRAVAETFWYPIWDAGLKLSPSAHTTKSLLGLASDDLPTATSLLTVRHLAGDEAPVQALRAGAVEQWHDRPLRWLARLRDATEERWDRFGEVSSLLEPDLKDGRGGLRDVDVLEWALATDLTGVLSVLDGALADLRAPVDTLLAVRCELHRLTGRPNNLVLLQDQDALAELTGHTDADALMRSVSSAARTIDWLVGRFWHRVDRGVSGLDRVRRSRALPEPIDGASLNEDEVDVAIDADLADQSFVFRVAAAAARLGVPITRDALDTMAAGVPHSIGPWTDRTRQAFISLLGSGDAMVPTVEALEHVGLFSRFLPEWRHVRSLPQRNAFHTYTVDRHLLVTVANAASLVRTVTRPDLLLVGALLHDIGKGHPGDHTEAGIKLVAEIVPRMGFPPDDVATISAMVEHHLLLAETATRRDLSDPRTAANVAAAVGDLSLLELLRALTEADSLATGPSAWSDWKRSLIDSLTELVAADLRGRPSRGYDVDVEHRFADTLEQVRLGGGVWAEHVRVGEYDQFRIATKDRPGLFAQVAGALALNRADVFGAEAWTSADGIAIEQFDILPTGSEALSFERIQQDLVDVIAGRLDIAARIAARVENAERAYRRAVAAAPPTTEVFVSNNASDSTTMIDVRVPDAPGVLYRLSAALAAYGATIRSAKVATLGHEVVDVFYVQRKGRSPRQLTPAECDEVRAVLRSAIAPTA
jgi:[protein-PII] uridylyltransferase